MPRADRQVCPSPVDRPELLHRLVAGNVVRTTHPGGPGAGFEFEVREGPVVLAPVLRPLGPNHDHEGKHEQTDDGYGDIPPSASCGDAAFLLIHPTCSQHSHILAAGPVAVS